MTPDNLPDPADRVSEAVDSAEDAAETASNSSELSASGADISTDNADAINDVRSTPAEIEAIENEIIDGVLEDLPREKRSIVRRLISREHRGPLPDPETFAAYEVVHPGAAGELLDGLRENRYHRFYMDRLLAGTARRSLYVTGAAVILSLAFGTVLGLHDQPVLGGIFGVGGLAPVLVGMIRGGGRWEGQ